MEGIIEKSSSNHKLVLDNYCKLIICHEEILSRIVKCFIDEANHLTLNEIERLIKEKKSFHHQLSRMTLSFPIWYRKRKKF